jgi:hypothetical protein
MHSEIGITISSLIVMGAITATVGIFLPFTFALGIGAGGSLIEI